MQIPKPSHRHPAPPAGSLIELLAGFVTGTVKPLLKFIVCSAGTLTGTAIPLLN